MKFIFRNICVWSALVISPSLFSQDKWDLKQCVDYARMHNISVRQADVQARFDRLTLEQSKLALLPVASTSHSTGYQFGRSIDPTSNQFTNSQILFANHGVDVGWDLFNWFTKRNTVAANKYNAQASSAQIDKVRDDISLNVANTYLAALLNREQVEITKVQIMQSQSQERITRKQVDAGALPELNALEMKTQLATDSSTYFTAVANYELSMLQLKALLNLDAATPFEIATPPVALIPVDDIASLEPELVYQSAIQFLPQQKVNNLLIQSALANVKVARGAMYPSISFFGGLSTRYSNAQKLIPSSYGYGVDSVGYVNYNNAPVPVFVGSRIVTGYDKNSYFRQLSDNFSQSIGLSLRLNIFNGGQARTQWKKAKLNVESQELIKEQDAQKLKQDIYQAYTNAMASLRKYHASSTAVVSAEKAYEFASKRYEVGLLKSIDLITNQNNLFRAKINKVLAQYDYVFKMKLLEFYKGQGLKL